ncbi:MAG: transporter [Candidatus Buchananbacteria bacterium]
MTELTTTIIVVFFLSLIGVLGDYFVKSASQAAKNDWLNLAIGALIYASTVLGWVYAMKHLKLASLGVYYGLFTTFILIIVGSYFFNERLNPWEIVGIGLGLTSLIILSRFT